MQNSSYTPRRLRNISEPSPSEIKESSPPSKKNIFFCIFVFLWKIIRILWYWFERVFLVVFLLFLTIGLAWWISQKPSLYRDWEDQDANISQMSWSGDTVQISGIRDYGWYSSTGFVANTLSGTFDLKKLQSLYYIITPFSDHDGPAHTMLSFGFSDGKNIVVSAEIRKERGESFDAVKGILNQFEIQYVIATESDVIKLRTNYRKNHVYMYPIRTGTGEMQSLFRSMLIRADKLSHEPEFYNTIWNNCTTSILMHANALRNEKIAWNKYVILPSHSDELLYSLGLIDTNLSLPQAREYYRIDEVARSLTGSGDFSAHIRKERK